MKKKIIPILLITAVISGIFIFNFKNKKSEISENEKLILNEYQLEPYLNLRGLEVSQIKSDKVIIPNDFTGTYKTFADEMEKSKFDLKSHCGQEVKRYIYSVDNYSEPDVIAELLLTPENELISAALIQQKPDGFIKSL